MIGQVGASRPQYYDRTATPTMDQFGTSGAAPHASTVRWTYTVPSGKKAYLEWVNAWLRRVTAAAPVGRATSVINYTPSGGAAGSIVIARHINNAVDAVDRDGGSVGAFLGAGDVVNASTEDLSTGGTVDYLVVSKRAEFDA
jgi:hypothetical protein